MPKMKTHSGAKKRSRVTAKGKVKAGKANRERHFMRHRSQDTQAHLAPGLDSVQGRWRKYHQIFSAE